MLAATRCADAAELLEKLMRWQVRIGGEFAPQVLQAAHEGDAAAQSIVRRVGETIGANAIAVARHLEMLDTTFDLVTAGGVFSSRSDLLRDSLLETVRTRAPRVNLIHWEAPPVVGALLMALDLLDLVTLPDTSLLAAQVVDALADSVNPSNKLPSGGSCAS
jgi:N-acetylglucosamine kinase-like BadF-type ATPase